MVISMDLRFREIDSVLFFKSFKKLTLLEKAHHTSLKQFLHLRIQNRKVNMAAVWAICTLINKSSYILTLTLLFFFCFQSLTHFQRTSMVISINYSKKQIWRIMEGEKRRSTSKNQKKKQKMYIKNHNVKIPSNLHRDQISTRQHKLGTLRREKKPCVRYFSLSRVCIGFYKDDKTLP